MPPRTRIDVPIVGEYRQDVVKTPDGLMWVYGNGTQDSLAVYHEMEPRGHSIHDYIIRHFFPGTVFLDVGAHVGHYSIRAAAEGCKVYAVEANPENAAQLRLNLMLNKITGVTLWAVAAWDRWELQSLNRDADVNHFRSGGLSVGVKPDGAREDAGITVACVPLDDLLADLDRLDLVKIDVEGSDLHVLDGMMDSLANLRPKIVLEDHSLYGYFTEADLDKRCEQLTRWGGYEWRTPADEGMPAVAGFRIGIPK